MNSESKKKILTTLGIAIASNILVIPSAVANGYHFLHQSAEGFGTAYATNGTAINDISAMFSNIASITRFDGTHLSTGAAFDFPRSNLTDVTATVTGTGNPVTGLPAEPSQPIDTAVGAATYLTHQFNDDVYLGLSFTAPFAYVSEYPDTAASRYVATLTKLYAYNLNPVVAWKMNDQLSLAAGLNVQLYQNDVNTMVPTNVVTPDPSTDVESRISGSDTAIGFTLGLEYQATERTRIGISYRSEISHEFNGDLDFEGTQNNLDSLLTEVPTLTALSGKANFDIDTPSMLQIGIIHKPENSNWEFYGNANLTGWSAFKDTHITFSNGFPDVIVDNDWDDSWFLGLGLGYQYSEKLKLRAGIAYDWSPTPAAAASPRAPNNDRMYSSLGASYMPNDEWKIDFGYMYLKFQEVHINLAGGNNVPRGTLKADMDLYANVFMFQLNRKF